METTSTALRNAKLAGSRETKAVVEFVVQNTPFPSGTTVSVSGEASVSNKDSVLEGIRTPKLIANFENSGFTLDGNYFLPTESEKYGWWSDVMSLEDGTFASNPYLTITMPSTYVDKITIIWGQLERPLEYKVIVNGTTTIEIDNNDDIIDIDNNVTSLKIEVVKWFERYKRAKIQCIDLGTTKIYTDQEILDLEIVENISHLGLDIPSNSCKVTIDNIAREWDILNPTGYYEYLSEGAPITIRLGHVTEEGIQYVQMGKFFLTEYEQDKFQMTFSAVDILSSKLDKLKFYGWGKNTSESPTNPSEWDGLDNGGGYGDYTIAQTITRLMEKIGLESSEYWIDPILNQDDWSNLQPVGWENYTKADTGRELLRRIQLFYNLNIYVNREGQICFSYFFETPNYYFTAGNQPTINQILLDDTNEKPIVKEIEQIKEIRYFPQIQSFTGGSVEFVPVDNTGFNVSGGTTIFITSDTKTSEFATISGLITTGSANITEITAYDFGYRIKTTGTGTIEMQIKDRTVVSFTQQFNETIVNENIEKGIVLELKHERFYDFNWQSEYEGKITPVQIVLLKQLFNRNMKYEYEFNWRQDITNNIGDILEVEHNFDEKKYMMITQQIYKYNGALSGTTKGVGN